jgi:zinc/manganese transport system substrate-binding protein
MMQFLSMAVAAILLAALGPVGAAAAVPIVAAENFYGDVAQQIGGADVTVMSVLSNPDQDPHLFEASPSVARAVAQARIVICNGIDYDSWMERLLRATSGVGRSAIIVAALVGRKPGDNPHIWYDPATMPALAKALADELSRADPPHAAGYRQRLAQFERSMQPIQTKIAALRARLAGTPVTATEPVFGDMLDALGMTVRNLPFQRAVMNNTEPSASDITAFESDLRNRRVRMLIYNRQATDPIADRMMKIAHEARVPVLGVTETEPSGQSYQAWMLGVLDAVDRALPK